MQAILIGLVKWVATTIIVPLIQQAIASYFKAKEKVTQYKQSKADAQAKVETYEKDNSQRDALP